MDFEAFLLEFSEIVSLAFGIPGLSAEPIQMYTSVQGETYSFVEDVRAGTIKLPCAVIDLGSDDHAQDFGITANTRRARVAVYYVAHGLTSQRLVHRKLVELMNAIEAADQAGTLQNFQAMEGYPKIDSGPESDPNRTLVAESAVRLAAGHIEWTPGFLIRT